MDLLERAVASDNRIISRITRDRFAFLKLQEDPNYGPRLNALVWESAKNEDDPRASRPT